MRTQTDLLSFFETPPSLNIYYADIEVHGILWFHWLAQPRDKYVHLPSPIIHNYALTLGLIGKPVTTSYVSLQNRFEYVSLEDLYKKYGLYVYPALVTNPYVKSLLFSLGGTGYLTMKPKTRAPVPDITVNTVFLAGTKLKTYVILRRDSPLCKQRELYIRIGAKRYGISKVILRRVSYKVSKGESRQITHPYNVDDVVIKNPSIIMRHPAGDIGMFGFTDRAFIVNKKDVLPIPKFIKI
mgnify:CR=1 FL=1